MKPILTWVFRLLPDTIPQGPPSYEVDAVAVYSMSGAPLLSVSLLTVTNPLAYLTNS